MDGENNGKPYEQMDDLGVPLFLETPTYIYIYIRVYIYMILALSKTFHGGIACVMD